MERKTVSQLVSNSSLIIANVSLYQNKETEKFSAKPKDLSKINFIFGYLFRFKEVGWECLSPRSLMTSQNVLNFYLQHFASTTISCNIIQRI